MVIRDVAACLLTHQKVSLAWLAEAMVNQPEKIAKLIGAEALHRTMQRSHDMLTPCTQAVLRKIASTPHTHLTLSALDKLSDGNSDHVIRDLLEVGLAYPGNTTSKELSYQLNEWLLTYVMQLL